MLLVLPRSYRCCGWEFFLSVVSFCRHRGIGVTASTILVFASEQVALESKVHVLDSLGCVSNGVDDRHGGRKSSYEIASRELLNDRRYPRNSRTAIEATRTRRSQLPGICLSSCNDRHLLSAVRATS